MNAPLVRPQPAAHPAKIETVLPERFLGAETALPAQPTVELERLYRKQRLAAGYRLFARYGFDMGGAGLITARDPATQRIIPLYATSSATPGSGSLSD